jgi:acyl carrier protein
MNQDQVLSTIKSIIKDDLGLNVTIEPQQSLLTTGTLDSMDWISFLTIVEEKFNVSIPAEDAVKHQIGVVQNLVKYLQSKTVA